MRFLRQNNIVDIVGCEAIDVGNANVLHALEGVATALRQGGRFGLTVLSLIVMSTFDSDLGLGFAIFVVLLHHGIGIEPLEILQLVGVILQ